MAGATIAVAMPVHNGAKWLPATLASLAAEADDGLTLIIRDSTPDESCAAIVETFRTRIAIDYAHWPEVPSWTRKTNAAVEAARADHVASLHQDDLWLPGRLAAARAAIARYPEAALHCGPAELIDAAGAVVGRWHPPFSAGITEGKALIDRLIVQNSIAMPSPVIRRADYLAVGGLDEALWYTPDWDLYLKLAERGPFAYDPQPLTAFRLHGSSLTLTGDRQQFSDQLAEVFERHRAAASPGAARLGAASVKINCLLADAAGGDLGAMAKGVLTALGLGPAGLPRYLAWSRIVERSWPRLKLRLAGRM